MSDCIFCRIAAGEIPAQVLYQDDQVMAFRDIQAQAPLHLLVIPRAHYCNVVEAAQKEPSLLSHLQVVAVDLAKSEGVAEDGFRLVINCGRAGGQSVNHLHLHLLAGRELQWPPG